MRWGRERLGEGGGKERERERGKEGERSVKMSVNRCVSERRYAQETPRERKRVTVKNESKGKHGRPHKWINPLLGQSPRHFFEIFNSHTRGECVQEQVR